MSNRPGIYHEPRPFLLSEDKAFPTGWALFDAVDEDGRRSLACAPCASAHYDHGCGYEVRHIENPGADLPCWFCSQAALTLEAMDAAAALESRYRDQGGALLDALDEARDLLQRHAPARLEQLERWARLSRTVRGY